MSKNIIDVDHVSIRFNLANQKVNNLKEYAIKLAKNELMFQEFMALKDVSLHVKPGESWGLIGTNGSGKSTLLKTIAGVLKPYKGSVKVRGRIAPMIELGAGFDMELTARENIYLNGAVLGFSHEFMDEHFEEIVDFAAIGKFLDSPIKNFSSGMKARLGFAVATMVDPDILICDEVLSVGDVNFRRRCNNRMAEMLSGGTTLLYVSHSIESVRTLCDHAIWLDHGDVIMAGEVDAVCDAYSERQAELYREERRNKAKSIAKKATGNYDFLVVGAGPFGSTFAYDAYNSGRRCMVIDKRPHVGGNAYTETIDDINVYKYGPHIYHTEDKDLWMFMRQFAEFNNYMHAPNAVYKDEMYNLAFNMNTFYQLWNVRSPEEAKAIMEKQIQAERERIGDHPANLEEMALLSYGRDIYEKLIKGYTEKMWGRPCSELPADYIKQLEMRFTYSNNYFADRYQGMPEGGFTHVFEDMLNGIEVKLNTSYKEFMEGEGKKYSFRKIIYTGPIDEYFDYCYGPLEYRSVRLETQRLPQENYQGNAVVHYTGDEVDYTRVIEHKHLEYGHQKTTVISKEYEEEWKMGTDMEPAIPINNEKNNALYEKYRQLAEKEENVIFAGRLGTYSWLNMAETVREARSLAHRALGKKKS